MNLSKSLAIFTLIVIGIAIAFSILSSNKFILERREENVGRLIVKDLANEGYLVVKRFNDKDIGPNGNQGNFPQGYYYPKGN